jgi:hypothetical protein
MVLKIDGGLIIVVEEKKPISNMIFNIISHQLFRSCVVAHGIQYEEVPCVFVIAFSY